MEIIVVFLPLIGPILASYFAVLVMRGAMLTKAKGGRSECDHCGKQLAWYELIPLLSFIIQAGKCRTCGQRLDFRIWISELLGFLMFLLFALGVNQNIAKFSGVEIVVFVLVGIVFAGVLLYLSIYDIFTYSVPTLVIQWGLGLAILVNVLFLGLTQLGAINISALPFGRIDNLLAGVFAALGFTLVIKLTKEKGLGSGDVVLAAIVGLLLGWPEAVSALYVMLISAALVGLAWALYKQKFKGAIIPLVPFIALGFMVAYVWGIPIFNLLFRWPGIGN